MRKSKKCSNTSDEEEFEIMKCKGLHKMMKKNLKTFNNLIKKETKALKVNIRR